ncbi:hypothetical protein C5E44_03660 [Nocardia nova]|uniref:YbaK/EbsC family protein n=1 Tax=Nocardia nova TaxID=37330 RepID=UPI000CE9B867|nr:hypothetical protein C5E44_03660 [Nocardia nova]
MFCIRNDRIRSARDQVRQATGQVIAGVAPVGHLQPLPTVVDALAEYPQLWAAAGTPHAVFHASAEELLDLTAALLLPVGP